MYERGLDIRMHGGQCCGIKVICGFLCGPHALVRKRKAKQAVLADCCGYSHSVGVSFFHEEAPKEKNWERFNRYMHFLEKRRPQGIVEVVLTKYQENSLGWGPLLLQAGFKEVSRCKNSNSCNTIIVYHFLMGESTFTPLSCEAPTPTQARFR